MAKKIEALELKCARLAKENAELKEELVKKDN